MAAQAAAGGANHSCLPRELAELVTRHLSPSALGSLFISSRTFGQQPTEELASRLHLDVALLDLGRAHFSGRLGKLAQLKRVQLTATAHATCEQLSEVVTLLTTHVPAMLHLSQLDLTRLPFSVLLAAASCLSIKAPPALVTLHLESTWFVQEDGSSSVLGRLWPPLARVVTLRVLELVTLDSGASAGDLEGLSALTQLRTLKMQGLIMSLSSLPEMPSLTQLTLDEVKLTDARPAHLVGLAGLQQLDILVLTPHSGVAFAATSWAQLGGLTSLSLLSDSFAVDGLPEGISPHAAQLTALVRLDAEYAVPTCADLLSLPSLVEVRCLGVRLPAAESNLQLLSVGSLTLLRGFANPSFDDADQRPQAVARTFPRLSSLSIERFSLLAPDAWPSGPVGSMLHLRSLSIHFASATWLLPLLAEAAVAVESLCLTGMGRTLAETQGAGLLPALHLLGRHLVRAELVGGVDGGIDDEGVCSVVDCWPHLHTLRIARSSRVTSMGMVKLSQAPRLRSVTLEGCCAVTALGVAALAARWSVEHLAVSGCAQVSLEDVRGILRMVGRPQLDFVFPGL